MQNTAIVADVLQFSASLLFLLDHTPGDHFAIVCPTDEREEVDESGGRIEDVEGAQLAGRVVPGKPDSYGDSDSYDYSINL